MVLDTSCNIQVILGEANIRIDGSGNYYSCVEEANHIYIGVRSGLSTISLNGTPDKIQNYINILQIELDKQIALLEREKAVG